MKTRALKWLFLIPLIFVFVLTAAKPAVAQDDGDDPPSRVARLSYTNGEVSFSPGGTDDWVAAAVNRPHDLPATNSGPIRARAPNSMWVPR